MVCTSNKKKFEEIFSILKTLNIKTIMPPKELEVEEYANTFLSNAHIKAKAYHDTFKIPTLADDSGLVVEALKGMPGVCSSRFYTLEFGQHVLKEWDFKLPKDELNNLKVLRLLEDKENRNAYFASAVVIILEEEMGIFGEGYLRGTIAYEPSGSLGFGYDPIFIPEGYDTTLANIEHKNEISHRKKALDNVVKMFKRIVQ